MTHLIGQRPEKGQSGAVLNRSSTPGGRVNFVYPSTEGTASVTIAAGASSSITVTTRIYDPSVPTVNQTSENLVPWSESVCWQFFDIYIDTDSNSTYQMGNGSALSADQKLVKIGVQYHSITPFTARSDTVVMRFFNDGASSHTVYLHNRTKIIITE